MPQSKSSSSKKSASKKKKNPSPQKTRASTTEKPQSFENSYGKVKKGKLVEFTVDKRSWYRGRDTGSSLLQAYNNQKCCIGFMARACGLNNADIRGVHQVNFLESEYAKKVEQLTGIRNFSAFYATNDNVLISNSERMQTLTEMFRMHGIKIKFK